MRREIAIIQKHNQITSVDRLREWLTESIDKFQKEADLKKMERIRNVLDTNK